MADDVAEDTQAFTQRSGTRQRPEPIVTVNCRLIYSAPPGVTADCEGFTVSQGSQASILLVEPPEDDRPMYAEFLRGQGFAVTEVDSTDAGLSAAPEADLIITGIRLAGSFDGIELVRRIRGDARTKHTPVIVLTACAFEPDQARAFAAGCDLFLPKPCLPEDLLRQAAAPDPPGDTASRPGPRARARGATKLRFAKARPSNVRPIWRNANGSRTKHR